jgi:hypothetical protein
MKNKKRKIQRLIPEQLDANYNEFIKDQEFKPALVLQKFYSIKPGLSLTSIKI